MNGNPEVVHRHAKYDRVGSLNLGDQCVIDGDSCRLFGRSLVGWSEQGAERDGVECRVRVAAQVAFDHDSPGIRCLQAVDDGVGHAGGMGVFAADAGVDLQNVHSDLLIGGFDTVPTLFVCELSVKSGFWISLFRIWNNIRRMIY